MSFDAIPEDMREGYPCDCGGSITLTDGRWCCDSCNFEKPDIAKNIGKKTLTIKDKIYE